MNIPQLIIHQQPAKIGLDIKGPQPKQKNAEAHLQIDQGPGELDIKADNVEINVDNYPAQYDLGFKKYTDAGRDYAESGKQAVLEYTGRKARNGDRLMRIEEGTSIAEIAGENYAAGEKSLSLQWKRGPEITVKKNNLEINHNPQKPVFNLQKTPFELELEWGRVNVFMEQYSNIDIEVRGSSFVREV